MTAPHESEQTGGRRGAASRVGVAVTPFQTDDEATIRLAQRAEPLAPRRARSLPVAFRGAVGRVTLDNGDLCGRRLSQRIPSSWRIWES